MFIFYFIILLLIPVTMIRFGLLWKENPPKTINWSCGYRTTWSMKSQETWDFAHKYAGAIWLYAGRPLAIISTVLLVAFRNLNLNDLSRMVLIITVIQLVGLLFPIVPTEIALKKRFDKNGNRK